MVEVHHDPVVARSDGEQQLTLTEFQNFARELRAQLPSLAPPGAERREELKCV